MDRPVDIYKALQQFNHEKFDLEKRLNDSELFIVPKVTQSCKWSKINHGKHKLTAKS